MAVPRVKWTCPGCERVFAIKKDLQPELCPDCSAEAEEAPIETPIAPFVTQPVRSPEPAVVGVLGIIAGLPDIRFRKHLTPAIISAVWMFVLITALLWWGVLTAGFVYSFFTEEARSAYDVGGRIAAFLVALIASAFPVLMMRMLLESVSVFFSTYSRVDRIASIVEEFELDRQEASAGGTV